FRCGSKKPRKTEAANCPAVECGGEILSLGNLCCLRETDAAAAPMLRAMRNADRSIANAAERA
ncbi:MAG: hypothetical protein LC664_08950, partial [Flavobacteriales bacterium]|nr:hypothetical protein [Flavobacteriales bacterium]